MTLIKSSALLNFSPAHTYKPSLICPSNNVLFQAFLLLSLLLPINTWAAEITPAHVKSAADGFAYDLNLVRLELGAQKVGDNLIYVTEAAPYEVFYQAMTLCHKASYMRFEWTRNSGQCPPQKLGKIKPSDVIKQVEGASLHIQEIKKYFNISSLPHYPPINPAHTPTDVFTSIMTSNRQLNALLKKRYAPDDVFREVTRGIYYSAELLANFPKIKQRIPAEPDFEGQKTPGDVYLRLVKAYTLIHLIHKSSGKSSLSISINKKTVAYATPSDVYDVATLLVSELSQLQWYLNKQKTIQAYQPSPKIPSQVYQRSGILLQQLNLFLKQVEANPNWLGKDS